MSPCYGMSPLLLAVESGHFELALQLVEHGADPNDQRSGYTPLHAVSWVRKANLGEVAESHAKKLFLRDRRPELYADWLK